MNCSSRERMRGLRRATDVLTRRNEFLAPCHLEMDLILLFYHSGTCLHLFNYEDPARFDWRIYWFLTRRGYLNILQPRNDSWTYDSCKDYFKIKFAQTLFEIGSNKPTGDIHNYFSFAIFLLKNAIIFRVAWVPTLRNCYSMQSRHWN